MSLLTVPILLTGQLVRWVEYERGMHARWMADVTGPSMHQVTDLVIARRPARLYRPSADAALPALVYLHGGGWVLGDIDCYDGVARRLAVACNTAVVSLGYRRAPEHPFPAALEDTVAAMEWLGAHGGEWGMDASRIGLAGDSAGGQLAAAAGLRLAASGGPRPALQLLIYPALDLRDQRGYPDIMTRVLSLYLGSRERTDGEVSPLLAPDLAGMPPTVIATAEHDVLHPQGEAFAARLQDAGVAATHLFGQGLQHGFLGQLGTVPATADFLTAIGSEVRRILHEAPDAGLRA
ncbi:hypothetical protein BJF79_45195 [Actinomadura sp. CNU-125]|nr:hypothetical protein BJF79_45195 [Actinomadura sp. CNU-125]